MEKTLIADGESEEVSAVDAWVFDKTGIGVEKSHWVVKERPVTLFFNGEEVVTLLCAGRRLDELAAGFFHAEGFLNSLSDLVGIKVDIDLGRVEVTAGGNPSIAGKMWEKRTVTSGCGKGSLFYYSLDELLSRPIESDLRVSAAKILERIGDLNSLSETYRRTHGVHNTALAVPEEILLFREDIGRHNAVDMVVGHAFLHGVTLRDKILFTTGRLTSEILIKAAKVKVPMLVSRNTATSLAVELARSLNITLIGYARGGKFAVYSGKERIAG